MPLQIESTLYCLASLTPFLVQAITGYGLDNWWQLRWSRRDNAFIYTGLLVLSVAMAVWLIYHRIYFDHVYPNQAAA